LPQGSVVVVTLWGERGTDPLSEKLFHLKFSFVTVHSNCDAISDPHFGGRLR